MRWLFWESDFDALDVDRDTDYILARMLEFGDMATVHWLLGTFGEERVHQFFREVGHPELSRRTIAFWRAYFKAEDERWATSPQWRTHIAPLWPG